MITADNIALDELKRYPKNPKLHDLGAIHASVEQWGFIDRILINKTTGHIVSGHGRLDVLVQRKAQGLEPPRGIETNPDTGAWMVPVDFVEVPENEEGAVVVALNRTTERGGWDDAMLVQVLTEARAQGTDVYRATGYDDEDVARILADSASEDGFSGGPQEDGFEIPAALDVLQDKWKTARGQIWSIPSKNGTGAHRLGIGDSMDGDFVKKLLAGHRPFLCCTDPPYGLAVDHVWRYDVGLHQNNPSPRGGMIEGDEIAGGNPDHWGAVYNLWNAEVLYIWHSGLHSDIAKRLMEAAGYTVRQQIIWSKTTFILGRAAYHWLHEPCWYAVKKGSTANWQGDHKQTTVWEFPSPISSMYRPTSGSEDDKTLHPTQKPIGLFAIPIKNHTRPGDVVAEPFAGSGSQFVAAEQTSRLCYGMEYDPRFAAVILDRLLHYGLEPRLESGELAETPAEKDKDAKS